MFRCTSLAMIVAVVAGVCSTNCSQLNGYERSAVHNVDSWADQVRSTLTPPSDEELTAKREQAQQQLQSLASALDEIPDGGWIRRVVHLNELSDQLSQPAPAIDQLDAAYQRLRHHYDPSVQARIDALRNTVDQLRGWLALRRAAPTSEDIERHVSMLAAQMKNPQAPIDAAQADQLRQSFGWLAEWRRCDELLANADVTLSKPNQVMTLSEAYLKSLAARDIVHPVTVNESQGSTYVSGQGDIRVVPSLEMVPNRERGEVVVHVDGAGVVPLVATSRPATVYANSHISFSGDQVLFLTASGVETPSPQISADSNTSLQSVQLSTRSRILRCLLRRVVEKLASRKLAESDVEAAARAQREIESEVRDKLEGPENSGQSN